MKRPKWLILTAVLGALTLIAAACGDDAAEDGDEDGPAQNALDLRDTIVLMGADGLLSDTFVAIPETEGMYLSGPSRAGAEEEYNEFVQKYEEAYGERPIQAFHSHTFDATNLLLDAIEAVADEAGDGSLTIGRQDLRDELYATEGFEGLTGTLECNDFGDCAAPSIAVYENTDPEAGIFATIESPVFNSETEPVGEVPEQPADVEPAQGEVEVGPGDPVKIAAHQAISGDVASLGIDQVRAAEIAINDRGGELLGHPIELTQEDDLCSEEGGTTGANRIVSDPQIIGVLGTSCSGAAVPASQIISEAGLVMISGSNTSPSLTVLGYLEEGEVEVQESWFPGYFRTAHNDEFQGAGAGQFLAEELGITTLATIHDGDPYTEGLVTQAGAFFEQFGGEVVLATSVNKGDTDMRPVLTDVRESGAEAIFFPIFQPEGDFIAQQALDIFG